MLPKGFWLQNEAFMDEIPESQGRPGCLEREVAKWQNRVTPTSPIRERLIAARLEEPELQGLLFSESPRLLVWNGSPPPAFGVFPPRGGVFPARGGVFPPGNGAAPRTIPWAPRAGRGLPSGVHGAPRRAQWRPCRVRGLPSAAQGAPRAVHGPPRTPEGAPRTKWGGPLGGEKRHRRGEKPLFALETAFQGPVSQAERLGVGGRGGGG